MTIIPAIITLTIMFTFAGSVAAIMGAVTHYQTRTNLTGHAARAGRIEAFAAAIFWASLQVTTIAVYVQMAADKIAALSFEVALYADTVDATWTAAARHNVKTFALSCVTFRSMPRSEMAAGLARAMDTDRTSK